MRHAVLLILSLFLANRIVNAQNQKLKIGEQFPDVELTDILYQPGKKIKMSDLKGKLVIFDFWSTACGPCIAGMPKMDSLQKEIGDKIAIFLVYPLKEITPEVKSYIEEFSKRNPIIKQISLPLVLDTNIRKILDFRVSYQAWVNKDGKLIAKTNEEYVNTKEISNVLKGMIPDWTNNNREFYNLDSPFFFTNLNITNSSKKYNSALSNYSPQFESAVSLKVDSVKNNMRYTVINFDITGLYKDIVSEIDSEIENLNNRIELNVSDSSKFLMPKGAYKNEWIRNNTICYEFESSIMPKKEFFNNVLQDLNLKLNLNARIEIQQRPVLVILESNFNNSKSKSQVVRKVKPANTVSLEFGRDIQMLVSEVKNNDLPVLDLRRINPSNEHKVIYLASESLNDIDIMKEELRKNSLQLTKSIRELKMLVISEK